jgi:hypothetical protein
VHLGRRSREAGDLTEAIRHLTLACALAPQDPDALFELARVLEEVDRPRALEAYQRYVGVAATNPAEAERVRFARERLTRDK